MRRAPALAPTLASGALFAALFGALFAVLAACDDTPDVTAPGEHGPRTGPLEVHTSTRALAALARRIGQDAINVTCPIPAASDPVWWRPNPEQTVAFQRADLIFLNGARLEKWALTISLPENRTVRTADGFEGDWLRFKKSVRHRHGPEGEHVHEGVDGHTWLDPILASKQVTAIAVALKERLPDHAKALAAAAAVVSQELAEIEAGFRALSMDGRKVTQTMPVWNYIVHRFGWTQTADGGISMPAPTVDDPVEAMRALLDHLKAATER